MSEGKNSLVGPIVAGILVAVIGAPVGGYGPGIALGALTFGLLAWLRSR